MSRENTVHDFDDHDLRGIVRASRFSYIGGMLGVFFDGEFNRESSVIAVKLAVRKDWVITPYRKTLGHEGHVRATVEFCFSYIGKTGIRLVGHVVGEKFTRGGEPWRLMLVG
jgi:hypothetical protein